LARYGLLTEAEPVVRPISTGAAGRLNSLSAEHHWLGHRLTGQVLRYAAVLHVEWTTLVGLGSAVSSRAVRRHTGQSASALNRPAVRSLPR
jgi:hypothetical protein